MTRAFMSVVSCVFFLSGVSALVFETLWFRQSGLALGNSVWASALVISSFMAGLALGNGLAARYGRLIRNPIRFYAGLEVVIAAAGLSLVIVLPRSTAVFALVLRPLMESTWLLQPARFATAFLMLLTPAVAMGATLPTLVKAVTGEDRDFGRILGRLYGINTLGAVVGAVTSELVWIPAFGILGSGCLAAAFNLTSAFLALAVARRLAPSPLRGAPDRGAVRRPGLRSLPLLVAAFLSGALLLALEVVWFRMLISFAPHTSEVFALMLGTVLAGIGLGGLLAALLLRVRAGSDDFVAIAALVSGAVTIFTYARFPDLVGRWADVGPDGPLRIVSMSLALMLPTSLLSGVLFTLIGKRVHRELGSDVRVAGLVTCANTVGSMLGPLLAGFLLLPRLGLERSMWALAVGYAGVAVCTARYDALLRSRGRSLAHLTAAGLFAWGALAFPFGLMRSLRLQTIEERHGRSEQLVALLEGVTGTLAYTRASFLGEPYYHRLITDGYSMSASTVWDRRYMSVFAHLPFAFHPAPRQVLLISYGVGNTAVALSRNDELERIDIVDISREILDASVLIFEPGQSPLLDPRVRVHVEDGRYFLNATRSRYDVITSEPPPPAAAGIVNLYTREYFELLYARLREGGLVSYWLPVHILDLKDAQAIVGSFCAVFAECSLWEGARGNWILLGMRGERGPLSESEVRRQWTDPATAPGLREIGLERPEQLAALFLADAPFLRAWAGGVPPLVDNWPHRAPRWRSPWFLATPHHYASIEDVHAVKDRFRKSVFLARLWPASFREQSLAWFDYERITRDFPRLRMELPVPTLHRILTQTRLETLPLWLLGSDDAKQRIVDGRVARGENGPEIGRQLALRALARRDYAGAAERLSTLPDVPGFWERNYYRLYALCMEGRIDEARDEARKLAFPRHRAADRYWRFMKETFDVDPPGPWWLSGAGS